MDVHGILNVEELLFQHIYIFARGSKTELFSGEFFQCIPICPDLPYIRQIRTDRDTLEKFAREQFRFAAPGEDVYVLE